MHSNFVSGFLAIWKLKVCTYNCKATVWLKINLLKVFPGFELVLIMPLYINRNWPKWVNFFIYFLLPNSSINNRNTSTYYYFENILNMFSIFALVQADFNMLWVCSLPWKIFNLSLWSVTNFIIVLISVFILIIL